MKAVYIEQFQMTLYVNEIQGHDAVTDHPDGVERFFAFGNDRRRAVRCRTVEIDRDHFPVRGILVGPEIERAALDSDGRVLSVVGLEQWPDWCDDVGRDGVAEIGTVQAILISSAFKRRDEQVAAIV